MIEKKHITNSVKNIAVGITYQVFTIVSNFVLRTVFVRILGPDYLGLSSLFTNIISVMSISEMGIGSAIIYSMYKPLATKDYPMVAKLINYYRLLYRNIAFFIGVAGILVLPFLRFIINLDTDIQYLYIYYFFYVIEAVSSYLFIYKSSILTAAQENYILLQGQLTFSIIKFVLQILSLLVLQSFFLYLVIQVTCNILFNVWGNNVSGKRYPFINERLYLEQGAKKEIWNNIKSMFSYKLGGIILNNTDMILISVLVDTRTVGLFSNYKMPISAISTMLSSVFTGIQASIGDLNVFSTEKEKKRLFDIIDIFVFVIYSFFTVCFCNILPVFVEIWLGKDYLIDNINLYIYAITFYFTGILYPIWEFRETVGLFKQTKYIMYIAGGINLLLSIVWGNKYGLQGILLATVIARLCTNLWYEPYKLFSIYFKDSVWKYYVRQVVRFTLMILMLVTTNIIQNCILINCNILKMLIYFLVDFLTIFLILFLYLIKNPEMKTNINIAKIFFHRMKFKRKKQKR